MHRANSTGPPQPDIPTEGGQRRGAYGVRHAGMPAPALSDSNAGHWRDAGVSDLHGRCDLKGADNQNDIAQVNLVSLVSLFNSNVEKCQSVMTKCRRYAEIAH